MQQSKVIRLMILLLVALASCAAAQAQTHDEPETVLVTYRVKAGQEAQMLDVLRRDWATVRQLKLVDAEPHVLVQGKDDSGKPIFVEVFTWASADTPDHVPPAVQAIWSEMGKLVETRDGRPGVDFRAVTPLSEKSEK